MDDPRSMPKTGCDFIAFPKTKNKNKKGITKMKKVLALILALTMI